MIIVFPAQNQVFFILKVLICFGNNNRYSSWLYEGHFLAKQYKDSVFAKHK